jgi:hypothetical protein
VRQVQGQAQQFVRLGRQNPKPAYPNTLRLYRRLVFQLQLFDTTSPIVDNVHNREFPVAKHEVPVH